LEEKIRAVITSNSAPTSKIAGIKMSKRLAFLDMTKRPYHPTRPFFPVCEKVPVLVFFYLV